jgi:hypothetical protein
VSPPPARALQPFAGASSFDYFCERVAPPTLEALERWKALQLEGYDVTALVDQRCTVLVGLGLRYRDEPPAA